MRNGLGRHCHIEARGRRLIKTTKTSTLRTLNVLSPILYCLCRFSIHQKYNGSVSLSDKSSQPYVRIGIGRGIYKLTVKTVCYFVYIQPNTPFPVPVTILTFVLIKPFFQWVHPKSEHSGSLETRSTRPRARSSLTLACYSGTSFIVFPALQ